MSNTSTSATAERCVSAALAAPTLEALPGRLTDLGGLEIRRLLPRSRRRLVGPWCFLDAYGPLAFSSGKPMDVAPHPHIGLQTVSWLVEGEVLHRDSLGLEGTARPGVLNLMTAGRGIAHSEETPRENRGRLHGVQLWIALPQASRDVAPAFEQHLELPVLELEGGRATLVMGELSGLRSKATFFSPLVATEIFAEPNARIVLPLSDDFEHALVPLRGACRLDGEALAIDTLYYLGCGRVNLTLVTDREPLRALLIGGAPFGETILMWWNFVARTTDEIASAREDWELGRRFGEVKGYGGERIFAPPFVPRLSSGSE
jgi:redox-sensitive bicupin YhaK (pirin superfamily)